MRDLAVSLGGGYYVDDWTRKHANFFRSIQLTKSVMFVILLLVVAVAAFNIISTLVMVVKDKQADIAILRTVGASPRSILAIFMTQGTAIGLIGTLAGVLLGVLIAVNLETLIHGLEAVLGTQFHGRQGLLHERSAGDGAMARRGEDQRDGIRACAACRRCIRPGARRARSRRRRCGTI